MDASSTALATRFLVLCGSDPLLRGTIADMQIVPYPDGLIAFITETPRRDVRLWAFVPAIVRLLNGLGHFKTLVVQTERKAVRLEMADLLDSLPASANTPDTLPASLQQGTWTAAHFEALANYKTRDCHVFVLGTDGIYKDVRLQRDSPASITPEQMIGNPIASFIGESEAGYLMEHLRTAYDRGEEIDLSYPVVHPNGEPRTYQGTLIPIPGSQACILLSHRVRQSVDRRSLVVSE